MKKSKNLTEITINNKKQYVVMGTGLRTLGLGMLNTDNIKEKMKMGDDKMEKFESEKSQIILSIIWLFISVKSWNLRK